MDNDYSWTKFNPAAARKLCAYSDRREELLTWLYSALPEETNSPERRVPVRRRLSP